MSTRSEQFVLNLLFKERKRREGLYYIPKFLKVDHQWYVGVFPSVELAPVSPNHDGYRKYHKIPGSEEAPIESLEATLEHYGFQIIRGTRSDPGLITLTHYIMYASICEGEVYS